MREGRLKKLEKFFRPDYDMPLIAERVSEYGYDVNGKIITEDELTTIAASRNVHPKLPKLLVIDLLVVITAQQTT